MGIGCEEVNKEIPWGQEVGSEGSQVGGFTRDRLTLSSLVEMGAEERVALGNQVTDQDSVPSRDDRVEGRNGELTASELLSRGTENETHHGPESLLLK